MRQAARHLQRSCPAERTKPPERKLRRLMHQARRHARRSRSAVGVSGGGEGRSLRSINKSDKRVDDQERRQAVLRRARLELAMPLRGSLCLVCVFAVCAGLGGADVASEAFRKL